MTELGPDDVTPLDAVPEICIEVLSHNRSYDRLAKRIYAEAGGREYWIVDPLGEVERGFDGLAEQQVSRQRLTSDLLPGFKLDLDELFASPAG